MNPFADYAERARIRGKTRREITLNREIRTLNMSLPDSLSYHTAVIYEPEYTVNIDTDAGKEHAESKNVAIINSDNLNEKMIFSMPGDDISNGSLVYWMDNYWIVTERDANMTVYTRAKMIQCNYLLRWISEDDEICEQWSIIEDGTKYLTGEYEDRNFVVTRGDSRIAMTITRNKETQRFGRSNRFLIDDTGSAHPMAYALTKPLKVGGVYNNEGTYKFVLQEITTTDDDRFDLMIADYYKHFKREGEDGVVPDPNDHYGKKVWL